MPSKTYRLAFQAAAVVVPLIMAAVAAVYGDPQPVIRDICDTLLAADAGATR